MIGRIPIMFDRTVRPEWIDFALEQYLSSESEADLRVTLRRFMSANVEGVFTQQKTALQLQRAVGYKSPLTRKELEGYYERLASQTPGERNPLRFEILCRSNPFFRDCVSVLRKIRESGVECFELKHVYERVTALYGDRGSVPRRVRYVLQTLAAFEMVTNVGGKWRIEDSLRA